MNVHPKVDTRIFDIETAMSMVFDSFVLNDKTGSYRAYCCGKEVGYKSGVIGPDYAYCNVCGAEIRNVYSPHVSPLLVRGGYTSAPTQEMFNYFGNRCWYTNFGDETKKTIDVQQ